MDPLRPPSRLSALRPLPNLRSHLKPSQIRRFGMIRTLPRAVLAALLSLTVALSSSGDVRAQDTNEAQRIVAAGTLKVGLTGTQPPFNVKARDGSLIGYEVDLATALAQSMGVEVEFVEMPFGELLGALESGGVDIVMSGMTMTPRRNLQVAFIGPYIVSGKSILTKSSTLATINNASGIDQSEITLAALRGSTSERFVRQAASQAQLILVDSYDEAVSMVRDGSADAMVADFPICAVSAMRYPDEGLTTLQQPLTVEPIGIALRDDALLINMITNFMALLSMTGQLDALERKWFQDGSWLSLLP